MRMWQIMSKVNEAWDDLTTHNAAGASEAQSESLESEFRRELKQELLEPKNKRWFNEKWPTVFNAIEINPRQVIDALSNERLVSYGDKTLITAYVDAKAALQEHDSMFDFWETDFSGYDSMTELMYDALNGLESKMAKK